MKSAGRQVLITGGGRGIGRHLTDRFLEQGHSVGVFERDEELVGCLRDLPNCTAWNCDVANDEDVKQAIEDMLKANFTPDVLVNNAGIIHSEPLVNFLSKDDRIHSRESWRRVLATDLDSVFYVTSRLIDQLLANKKSAVVISMSSIAANGNAGQSAYAAAKAGVNSLTKTWAKELGPLGFRFAAIAPGFLDTPSTHAALTEARLTALKQKIPLRRLGQMEDIYRAVEFVVNNEYINGTILEVDGGLVI